MNAIKEITPEEAKVRSRLMDVRTRFGDTRWLATYNSALQSGSPSDVEAAHLRAVAIADRAAHYMVELWPWPG